MDDSRLNFLPERGGIKDKIGLRNRPCWGNSSPCKKTRLDSSHLYEMTRLDTSDSRLGSGLNLSIELKKTEIFVLWQRLFIGFLIIF